MKAMTLHLPEHLYEQIIMEAAAAQKSPEQWIIDRLFTDAHLPETVTEPHTLLAAALEALGFRRLEPRKAQRLSALLTLRKHHPLSPDEADELQTLMTEADALVHHTIRKGSKYPTVCT
jgi:hypothetical protein